MTLDKNSTLHLILSTKHIIGRLAVDWQMVQRSCLVSAYWHREECLTCVMPLLAGVNSNVQACYFLTPNCINIHPYASLISKLSRGLFTRHFKRGRNWGWEDMGWMSRKGRAQNEGRSEWGKCKGREWREWWAGSSGKKAVLLVWLCLIRALHMMFSHKRLQLYYMCGLSADPSSNWQHFVIINYIDLRRWSCKLWS